jgi:hypothetical protein
MSQYFGFVVRVTFITEHLWRTNKTHPQHSTVLVSGLRFSPIHPDHFLVEQDQTLVIPMTSRFFHVYDVQRMSESARISEERFRVRDRVLGVLD